jgi:hypothetical protein
MGSTTGFEVGVIALEEEVGAAVEANTATSMPVEKRLSSSSCATTTPHLAAAPHFERGEDGGRGRGSDAGRKGDDSNDDGE